MILTLIGVSAGALVGRLAPWAPLVPVIVLVVYLRALRRSARQMALARRREQARRDVRRVAGPSPLLLVASPHVSVRADVAVPAAAIGAVAGEVAERRAGTAPRTAAASTAVPAPGGNTWEPQPVPLPTYVTAPKAARSIRTIDLTTPGSWTSGRLDPLAVGTPMPGWAGAPGAAAEEAPASPYPAATPAAEDPPTGEIEVRRAVGD